MNSTYGGTLLPVPDNLHTRSALLLLRHTHTIIHKISMILYFFFAIFFLEDSVWEKLFDADTVKNTCEMPALRVDSWGKF